MWWLFNFPTFPGPTFSPFPFPLSPFPFPFSPFPFPLSPFPFPKVHKQIVCSNNQNQNQIEVVTYTTVNNRCAIAFQTGGSVFSVAPFLLGGGGGREAGKHPIVGGGMGGGGFPVKNLVWTMAGGGGGIGPLDPPPVHKNMRHLRGQTAHTTSLIRHQTSDLIHIAVVPPTGGTCNASFPASRDACITV